ncbi:cysteine desulfurase [Oikeobacillus pervagus]|uniref:Cysteine desulfurase n=1 Tax=Oikeobacillus pervagus TaxID=1325931 RepID=A0AAJ1T561_9BACI|nr:cysteine desulfurase family protein [Oikeobacillus pervagus]MDQ0215015.1 cysteine desulfurase [Oikeobacillus pervagus]
MIYFDNSATTKPYHEVLRTFVKVNEQFYGNPSSLHHFGVQAEKLLSQARKQIATLMNVKEKEIFFTSGGTESNNLAIKGTAIHYRNRGNHIITSSIEHPSVLLACEQLEQLGFRITYLPVNSEGIVKVEDVERAIDNETILVSIMHVNNEIGSVQPIDQIGELLRNHSKILFHVDHVQGIGKLPLLLGHNIDLCTISGHKFHGLKGTGALFIREGVKLSPLLSGGSQEQNIRSGTENTGGMVAMAKALRLTEENRKTKRTEMQKIHQFLREGLSVIKDVTIHTPSRHFAPHILNFSVADVKGEVLVHALEAEGLFVSTTSACSSKRNTPSRTLLAMGVQKEEADGSIRISLSYENTMDEAKQFIEIFSQILPNITRNSRG